MMKPILTLLLIVGMSLGSIPRVMAALGENYRSQVEKITSVSNSDCKGDRDDDCR